MYILAGYLPGGIEKRLGVQKFPKNITDHFGGYVLMRNINSNKFNAEF